MGKKNNVKALNEQRNEKLKRMDELLAVCEGEEARALTDAEQAEYDSLEKEVKALNETIQRAEKRAVMEMDDDGEEKCGEQDDEGINELEARAFVDYLRSGDLSAESRSDGANLTFGDNGAIVPKSIARKIIDRVTEMCPIYARATHYNVPGTLDIPYVDTTTDDVTAGYADDFTDLEKHANAYNKVTLNGYLYGALTLIGKRLINNAVFDVTGLAIERIATKMAYFKEGELIHGTSGKVTGALAGIPAEQTVTAASATAITADELMDVQDAIPDVYQANACWIMNKATRKAIRKLKDGEGNYLLVKDFSQRGSYTLLGMPVFLTENMDAPAAGKTVILYGDMSGLAVKETGAMEVGVQRETYAAKHAIGVWAYHEMDAKVENAQKLSKLVMKA